MPGNKIENIELFNSKKQLTHTQFLKREYATTHLSYEREFEFYRAVQNGDLETIQRIMVPLENEQLGHLSDNPVRNLTFHLIVTIAMITRFCIEGGMPPEMAYTLSDMYIQKLDLCTTEKEINLLHRQVIRDFTNKMKIHHSQKHFSKPVLDTMDYIYNHLHTKISLDNLAKAMDYNKTYLCDIFKKETNLTIGQYITSQRIEPAKNMLLYSDYSSSAISQYLAFSSHSHFISVFKKEVGVTPREYQKLEFRENLS